jgi:hypothetical protein
VAFQKTKNSQAFHFPNWATSIFTCVLPWTQMICTRQASQETNRKWKNIHISNIHQFLNGAMPQPSGITLQFQDGVCQRGGPGGGGWGRRTTRKCIDIFVSNKKERKRKDGGEKNNTKPFACTQKSQCTHTSTQAMTRGRDDEGKFFFSPASFLPRSHGFLSDYRGNSDVG